MRYLFTLIFWFAFLIIYSQNKSWHNAPEGNVVLQWLQYDEDYFYYNDKLYTGFAFELHYDFNLKSESKFKEGIKISEKRWLKNGELDYDYRAEIDEKKNIISEYNNGSLYKKTFIKKQLKTTRYYENNIKTSETEELIKDSVAIKNKWDNLGNLIEKSVLKKGLYGFDKNGPSTMWYKNGKKMFECNFTGEWYGGTLGKQNTYYNNGKMAISGEVNNFNQKEIWNFFDENQTIRIKEICLKDSLRNRNFNFYSKDGILLSNNEISLGVDYRTLQLYDFTKEYPMSVNLPINHPDISITRDIPDSLRNEHYYECIELKKSVNFIKIEFIDQGCGIPLTSFSFRDKNNNELFEHNNYSFGQRHLVISDKTLLSKTKFIYHSTCEGPLIQLVVLYE
jgi:antitoxin component YwqK of YwqJK toxin-antitoxin module